MSLSGFQKERIQRVLLASFDESELRTLVSYGLEVQLDHIVPPGDLTQRVFHLVEWADRHGCIPELIEAALNRNNTNRELKVIATDSQSWFLEPPEDTEAIPPYQGLAFYGEVDAERFFGREALTADLLTHIKNHAFLAVLGASGCGKSSLIRAGVVPGLKKGTLIKGGNRWVVHVVTPTARPLVALAAELTKDNESVTAQATLIDDLQKDQRSLDLYLSRVAAQTGAPRVLLVIDQFEELFTLCHDRSIQQLYINNLLTAAVPTGLVTVVLTLRADFYADCAEFAELRLALQDLQKYIGPMSHDELKAAIEKPAIIGNWDFEPGLVDAILDDVEGEAGALPLLSHALLETWKRRNGRVLTFSGYHAAGCVKGAIAKTADEVYDSLTEAQKIIARDIFLRLTNLGEGTQDTRRRVSLLELLNTSGQASQVQEVLKFLEDGRLVTAERVRQIASENEDNTAAMYVDVTHEALIREWPTLSKWLNEDRVGHLVHRRLTEAAEDWSHSRFDVSILFRGARLLEAIEWASLNIGRLNKIEQAFLDASQRQAEAEQRERDEGRNRELRQAQKARNRALLALFASVVALVMSVTVGWFLYNQNINLQGQQLLADAHRLREQMDAEGAIAKLRQAAEFPGVEIDLSAEISSTERFVATQLVRQGEQLAANGNKAAAISNFVKALALTPPTDTAVYVCVDSGNFVMGSRDQDKDIAKDEIPQHSVFVGDFWIMNTEVTNEQYARCVEAGKCSEPGNSIWKQTALAKQPVTDVDWFQANLYSQWVGGRLPTEAEWEKSCRGTDGRIYPWGNDPPTPQLLNFGNSRIGAPTNIATYPQGASPYNVMDLAGNVYEWTSSVYMAYPFKPNMNIETNSSVMFSLRGAGFGSGVTSVRCARRAKQYRETKNYVTGFRIVIAATCDSAAESDDGSYGQYVPNTLDRKNAVAWQR
jgi:formylglycine-generating enzyme required for sulfatase activity